MQSTSHIITFILNSSLLYLNRKSDSVRWSNVVGRNTRTKCKFPGNEPWERNTGVELSNSALVLLIFVFFNVSYMHFAQRSFTCNLLKSPVFLWTNCSVNIQCFPPKHMIKWPANINLSINEVCCTHGITLSIWRESLGLIVQLIMSMKLNSTHECNYCPTAAIERPTTTRVFLGFNIPLKLTFLHSCSLVTLSTWKLGTTR